MSVMVSISNASEDIWMINNSTFRWFAGILAERFADDQNIVSEIEITEAINGISLHREHKRNPNLTIKFASALRAVAREVAEGSVSLPCSMDDCTVEDISAFRAVFGQLAQLIDRWEPCSE